MSTATINGKTITTNDITREIIAIEQEINQLHDEFYRRNNPGSTYTDVYQHQINTLKRREGLLLQIVPLIRSLAETE